MSYKVAVKVKGEPQWSYNAQRFATKKQATAAADDLSSRWMLVDAYEIQSSPDPVNYKWRNGKAIAVETPIIGVAPPTPVAPMSPVVTPVMPEQTIVTPAPVIEEPLPVEEPLPAEPEPLLPEESAPMLEPVPEPEKKVKKVIKPKSKPKRFGDGSIMKGVFD